MHDSSHPAPVVAVNARIDFHSESNFYEGFGPSEFGVFVASHVWQRIGTLVELFVELPGGYSLQRRGIVKWISVSEDEGIEPGMGIELDDLEPDSADLVAAFTACREPRFHTSVAGTP